MQFKLGTQVFNVVILEVLDSNDPMDCGFISSSKGEIQLLKQVPTQVLKTLAHEVTHAWLGTSPPPMTSEDLCTWSEDLLITFFDEFNKQGGRPALWQMLGVPFEGDTAALEGANWKEMDGATKRRFIIRNTICHKCTDAQAEVFMARADAAGLDPLRGDCWPAFNTNEENDALRVEARTTIKAMRRIAMASPSFGDVGNPEWCGVDEEWKSIWLDTENPPAAARVSVYRKGSDKPIEFIARWSACAKSIGKTASGKEIYGYHWRVRQPEQLAKCAEAGAYARAIPECDGLYVAEQTDRGDEPKPTAAARKLIEKRKANHLKIGASFGSAVESLPTSKGVMFGAPVPAPDQADDYAIDFAAQLEDDRKALGLTGDEKWLAIMRDAVPWAGEASVRQFYNKVKELSGTYDVDEPLGFERMLIEQTKAEFRRRA